MSHSAHIILLPMIWTFKWAKHTAFIVLAFVNRFSFAIGPRTQKILINFHSLALSLSQSFLRASFWSVFSFQNSVWMLQLQATMRICQHTSSIKTVTQIECLFFPYYVCPESEKMQKHVVTLNGHGHQIVWSISIGALSEEQSRSSTSVRFFFSRIQYAICYHYLDFWLRVQLLFCVVARLHSDYFMATCMEWILSVGTCFSSFD